MPRHNPQSSLSLTAWVCVIASWVAAFDDALAVEPADATSAAAMVNFTEPAAGTGDVGAAPLLAYRRSEGERESPSAAIANPLRTPAPPAAAAFAIAEPTPGQPSYATPAAAIDPAPAANAPLAAAKASEQLDPPPVAPLDDDTAAPLADYKAPSAAPGDEAVEAPAQPLPAAPPALQLPNTPGEASSVPSTPPLGAAGLEADSEGRRLAPRTKATSASGDAQRSPNASFLPGGFAPLNSLASAGAGLAIVIALFLLFSWTMRRGAPKAAGVLPESAFAVLGRAPLTAHSFAQLLRVGNKLVLVAITADGAQTLTEVTDPLEVDRIAGLCMSSKPTGSSAEFQQMLAQLSKEPARGFLGREASQARRRA